MRIYIPTERIITIIIDTIIDIPEDSIDPSIHLTIGVDTLIWSLTYAGLRSMIMKRAGVDDKLIPTKLPSELYWKLHVSHVERGMVLINSDTGSDDDGDDGDDDDVVMMMMMMVMMMMMIMLVLMKMTNNAYDDYDR
jgi:hypothetical protein